VVFSVPLQAQTLAKSPLAALWGKWFRRKRPSEFAE